MKKYQVFQGKMTRGGTGDYTIFVEFDTKEEAMNYFEDIKNDTKGWNIDKKTGEYLHTMVTYDDDFEKIIADHIVR